MRPGVPYLDETWALLRFIEFLKPKRIASVHGHHVNGERFIKGVDAPGVFVDPRYMYEGNKCQRDPMDPTKRINHEFETNECKFDLFKDPAFPQFGLFKQLNDVVVKRKVNDPQLAVNIRNIKDLENESRELESQALEQKGLYRDAMAKYKEAVDEANKIAQRLGISLKTKNRCSALNGQFGPEDDGLALELAKAIEQELKKANIPEKKRVPGNHLGVLNKTEVVHYAQSTKPAKGFSLGDWGPVDVSRDSFFEAIAKAATPPGGSGMIGAAVAIPLSGIRYGAPVITVELYEKNESGAFHNGVQLVEDKDCKPLKGLDGDKANRAKRVNKDRCKELQAYAEAMMKIFLDKPVTDCSR